MGTNGVSEWSRDSKVSILTSDFNARATMRREVVTLVIAILMIASLGIGYLSGSSARRTETITSTSVSTSMQSTQQTVTSTTTSTSTETSVFTQGIFVPISSASTLNPLTGLSLDLNLSGGTDGQVVVTTYEYNTLNRINNVSYGNGSWPKFSLFQWTHNPLCDAGGMEGYEILQGNHGSSNFTSGDALWLQPQWPSGADCGEGLPGVGNSSYAFQPLSARNLLSGIYVGSWSGQTIPEGGQLPNETLFPPGTYTVLAGDQWGEVAILHFIVAG
jgi:hypothetical protein